MLVMAEKYIFNLELLWGDMLCMFIHMMGDSPPTPALGSPLYCDLCKGRSFICCILWPDARLTLVCLLIFVDYSTMKEGPTHYHAGNWRIDWFGNLGLSPVFST